jgi:hypothetical protein
LVDRLQTMFAASLMRLGSRREKTGTRDARPSSKAHSCPSGTKSTIFQVLLERRTLDHYLNN